MYLLVCFWIFIGLSIQTLFLKICLSGPNGVLREFLKGLAEANDVPTYVKDNPIEEPAITSSHSDWDYYSKVIRSLGKKRNQRSQEVI